VVLPIPGSPSSVTPASWVRAASSRSSMMDSSAARPIRELAIRAALIGSVVVVRPSSCVSALPRVRLIVTYGALVRYGKGPAACRDRGERRSWQTMLSALPGARTCGWSGQARDHQLEEQYPELLLLIV
jgi:hypothetical protein